jgi:hypothetical protein
LVTIAHTTTSAVVLEEIDAGRRVVQLQLATALKNPLAELFTSGRF